MAVKKNTSDLLAQAASTLPDNTTQQISPQDSREMAENIAFSSFNKITDTALVGLKEYSIIPTYEAGQGCVNGGSIYISNKVTGPGVFAPADWDILTTITPAQASAITANTAKVSADGSINTHSDVDIVTSTPSIGEGLIWDGIKFVPGSISVSLTDGNGTTGNGTSVDLGGDLTSDVIITGNQKNLILGAGPLGDQLGVVQIAADSFFMYAVDAVGAPGGGNIQMFSTGLTLGASPVNGTITLLSKDINYNVFGDMGITLGSPTGTFTFAADYSANYTPRSIPDVAFVTNMLTDGNGTTALGTSVNLGGTLTGPVTINGNGSSFNMGTLSSPIQFYNSTAEEHSLFAYDTLLGSVQNQVTLDKDGFEINTTGGNGRVFVNANDVAFNGNLGLFGTTPIAQPTTAVAASILGTGAGTGLTDLDTFDGYTLQQVVKALRNLGILA